MKKNIFRLQSLANRTKAEVWAENILMCNFSAKDYIAEYPMFNRRFDFYFPRIRIAIEIDGGYHNEFNQKEKDIISDKFMQHKSINVFRVSNFDSRKMNEIVDYIKKKLYVDYIYGGVPVKKYAPMRFNKATSKAKMRKNIDSLKSKQYKN